MKIIALTQGKVTRVDDDVYEWASKFKWYARRDEHRWYAVRNRNSPGKTQRPILLHREILQLDPAGPKVDHKDGDGLNNLRENIRPASNQQNVQNRRHPKTNASSKFLGVRLHQGGSWQARIKVNGKTRHLGCFKDEEAAARSYDIAAREAFGEFACPNFL